MGKFNCNFKYIFINEIGFIKKIVLVVGKINKSSRVLRDEAGFCKALRGGDETKSCAVGAKTQSFGPALSHCHA